MDLQNIKQLISTLEQLTNRTIKEKVPKSRIKANVKIEEELLLILPNYALYVDSGRKKGKMPPIQPIKEWIKRKNIKVKNITTDQLAFAVAKSISVRGIEPKPFIDEVIKLVLNELVKQSLNTKILS